MMSYALARDGPSRSHNGRRSQHEKGQREWEKLGLARSLFRLLVYFSHISIVVDRICPKRTPV